jgi:hypothetical protein
MNMTMYINSIKVIDWKTKIFTYMTRIGKDNWVKWLISQEYQLIDSVGLGNVEIDIYQENYIENTSLYAILFPDIARLDTECLFINIPTKEEAYRLISDVTKRLEPLIKYN